MRRRRLLAIAAMLGLAGPSIAAESADAPADAGICEACEVALDLALAHERRAGDRPRDAWRHPAKTLAFFRVEPGMSVVDFMPGEGWYTRILAPYLGGAGHYVALNPDVTGASEQRRAFLGDLGKTFPARAAQWTGLPETSIAAYNSDGLPKALDGTVDRVLVFREMHNLKRFGMLDGEMATIRRLLKPDGLLGIEQHRARPDAPGAYIDGSKGYLREADVIAMVEARGFALVGRSEINANPKDTADYPEGVWTLPPSYRLKDHDRERYAAIGESDRMTLLFRKRS